MHYCSATRLEQKMKLLFINLIDMAFSFAKLSFFTLFIILITLKCITEKGIIIVCVVK